MTSAAALALSFLLAGGAPDAGPAGGGAASDGGTRNAADGGVPGVDAEVIENLELLEKLELLEHLELLGPEPTSR